MLNHDERHSAKRGPFLIFALINLIFFIEHPLIANGEDIPNPPDTVQTIAAQPTSPIQVGNNTTPGRENPTPALAAVDQPKQLEPVTLNPPRRAFPAPFDSPPFPSSEWPIGGTNPIGAPDTSDTYPLMQALYKTPMGDTLRKSRIKIYGWLDIGGNLSTSKNSNKPAAYPIYPNEIDLDQAAMTIERIPNSVQKEHVDWGFRFMNFYGLDYRYTTAKGYFSNQLLKYNNHYGYDPILMYGDLYIPYIAQGLNIRVGRFLSIPDIEAQLAPDNYMYTHTLMYTNDIYTQTGTVWSLKLNNQWTVQGGLTVGNDIAPWQHGDKPTGLAGVQWISKSNKDSIYLVADSINNGHYAYNNIQEYVGTWSHKFNDIVHAKTEAYYLWEDRVPVSTLPSGIFPAGKQFAYTGEWALLNYLEIKLSKAKDYLSIRNEFMNDPQGQRTGFATSYTSHGIGWTHWFNKCLGFRPEIRYEHAYDRPAYDLGRKKNQFMFAADMIVRY